MAKIYQVAITSLLASTALAHSALQNSDSTTELLSVPQMKRELPTRKQNIDALQKKEYDVLIIGGGAVGAGCALDAATRGLKTAMVDANDFANGTSSKSTKLLHGGIRDMNRAFFNMDVDSLNRIKSSLKECKILTEVAPHLNQDLPILMPVHHWWQIPLYWVQLSLYKLMGPPTTQRPYFIGFKQVTEAFPIINKSNLLGAFVFHEMQHDDARMCLSVALTAARYGADICNYMKVVELIKNKEAHVCGAKVIDQLNGKKYTIRAKSVINATGAYTDVIREMDDSNTKPICSPSMGTHVVLPGYYCPQNVGIFDPNTKHGSVIFFLPWQGHTIVGTTDVPSEPVDAPKPTEAQIQLILNGIRDYVNPNFDVRRCDVLSVWSGLRPLPNNPNNINIKSPQLGHILNISDSNLITVVGGNLTTFRLMAEKTINAAVKYCNLDPSHLQSTTAYCKLDGAASWSPQMYIRLVQDFGVEEDVAKHLSNTYGFNAFKVITKAVSTNQNWPIIGKRLHPTFPYIEAEVRQGVQDYACTLIDMIARRLRIAFLNVQAAEEMLPQIASIMANELGWSYDTKMKQIAAARAFLSNQMGKINLDAANISIPIKMSVKQVQKYAAHFRYLDENNTGYVSISKCCKAMKNLGVKEVPVELMHDVLRDIDSHAQGKVNIYEFLLLMSAIIHGDTAYLRYAKLHIDQKLAIINNQKANVLPVERSGGGL